MLAAPVLTSTGAAGPSMMRYGQPQACSLHQYKIEVEEFFRDDLFGLVRVTGASAMFHFKREDRQMHWCCTSSNSTNKPPPSKQRQQRQQQQSPPTKQQQQHEKTPSSEAPPSSKQKDHVWHLLAFGGVFDGHEGFLASEYCAKGLLPHLMLETERSFLTRDLVEDSTDNPVSATSSSSLSPSSSSSSPSKRPSLVRMLSQRSYKDTPEVKKAIEGLPPLQASYVRAFHIAQEHFGQGEEPPALPPSPLMLNMVPRRQSSLRKSLRNLLAKQHDEYFVPGGTTACTLSIYHARDDDSNNPAGIYAVAANCGDSRLICDNGSRSSSFQQVTRDHRPADPLEAKRLKQWCEETGEGHVSLLENAYTHRKTARVFPGGLAVSRTIGDVNHCKGVVPTPDVYQWRLDDNNQAVEDGGRDKKDDNDDNNNNNIKNQSGTEKTIRFVLATDGLWDVTTNELVGALAAQQDASSGEHVTPKSAANQIMEHCLDRGGGIDDVSILIMDITIL